MFWLEEMRRSKSSWPARIPGVLRRTGLVGSAMQPDAATRTAAAAPASSPMANPAANQTDVEGSCQAMEAHGDSVRLLPHRFFHAPNGKQGGMPLTHVGEMTARGKCLSAQNILRDAVHAAHRIPPHPLDATLPNAGDSSAPSWPRRRSRAMRSLCAEDHRAQQTAPSSGRGLLGDPGGPEIGANLEGTLETEKGGRSEERRPVCGCVQPSEVVPGSITSLM